VPVVEAEPVPPPAESGIASPLTEISRKVVRYIDGPITYYVAAQMTFEDANGSEVVMDLLHPESAGVTVLTAWP